MKKYFEENKLNLTYYSTVFFATIQIIFILLISVLQFQFYFNYKAGKDFIYPNWIVKVINIMQNFTLSSIGGTDFLGALGSSATSGYVGFLITNSIFNAITLVMYLLLLYSAFDYKQSKGQNTSHLLFLWSYIYILLIFVLCTRGFIKIDTIGQLLLKFNFLIVLITAIKIVLAYFIVKTNRPQNFLPIKSLKKEYYVKSVTRFGHLLFDSLLLLGVITTYLFYPVAYLDQQGIANGSEDVVLVVLLLVFYFIYYMATELSFNRTPAKYLSNTYVTVLGQRENNGANIFIRNLCRRIPFDSLSFLFENNWHDRFSETAVVKDDYIAEEVNDTSHRRTVKGRTGFNRPYSKSQTEQNTSNQDNSN